eukprot:CAMPEP_0169427204 /NCGR_PEP_ID=MMETSP1042-20121227/643_1 /TAXON_ID=464988 /ORGANISM="Hemiselmis andersenii, Strain CCMP1180" /LENGTH=105 /DNA_ID=CAMNT_0009537241 /DNA_START=626 /DNA_END=943 /DNA_ORIENTATION=+
MTHHHYAGGIANLGFRRKGVIQRPSPHVAIVTGSEKKVPLRLDNSTKNRPLVALESLLHGIKLGVEHGGSMPPPYYTIRSRRDETNTRLWVCCDDFDPISVPPND